MRLRASASVLAGVLSVALAPTPSGEVPPRADHVVAAVSPAGTAPTRARGKAPRKPPARICGSRQLDGPAARPRGALRVSPDQDLPSMVDRAPAGATFWLASGIHTFGPGEFDQVGPKDRQTFIGAPGAVIDGRGVNRYAFGGSAADVTIEHLTIQNFVSPSNEGVVNHDSGDRWRVRRNTIRRNGGAGVFLGDGAIVSSNCIVDNGQYGFSAYEPDGVENVVLRRNEIARNNTDDWESREPGCGCTGGGKFWDTRGATIVRNWIHDNRGPGLWADTNNTGFLIRGNYFSRNDAEAIVYEISYNAAIRRNTFVRNGLVEGPRCDCFGVGAIYLSEAGSDPRAGSRYGRHLHVAGNRFVNNWSAIFAWENADRFAGSPNNTSTGFTTLVNPGTATEEACGDPGRIGSAPFFDDCRWKTQALRVHDNVFRFSPAALGPRCTRAVSCGYMGLLSNFGTSPEWSPYQGHVVQDNITFEQDNVWSHNRYVGPWRFLVHDFDNDVPFRVWRQAPYRQDRGSTLE